MNKIICPQCSKVMSMKDFQKLSKDKRYSEQNYDNSKMMYMIYHAKCSHPNFAQKSVTVLAVSNHVTLSKVVWNV